MAKKIIITGGAGFIGNHVARELLKKNYEVYSFDIKDGNIPHVKYYTIDLKNKEQMNNLIQEVHPEAIIHLGGLIKGTYEELYSINVLGTKNILDCFIGRIIFISTSMVYQGNTSPYHEEMPTNPKDDYPKTKKIAEDFCLQRKNTVIVRASVVYGPGQKSSMFISDLEDKIKKGEVFKMTKGEQMRDFIHVKDLCNAFCILLENNATGIFNISSGEHVSMQEVITLAKEIVGDFPLEQTIPYRENELWDHLLSREKAKKILNWEPKISLEQGLREVLTEKEVF